MAMVVALLDTLLAPSTDRVDNVYCQLKDILDVTVMQQVESSLQWQAEVSMSSSGHSKASQQRTVTELPMAGTASSPTQVLAHIWPGHQSGHLEPPVRRKAHQGDEGAHSEHHTHNLCHDGCNDQEGHNLSAERLGPKVFWGNVHDACFPKCFRALNNIINYDGKMNPNI
jgi:hypothetical protein